MTITNATSTRTAAATDKAISLGNYGRIAFATIAFGRLWTAGVDVRVHVEQIESEYYRVEVIKKLKAKSRWVPNPDRRVRW